MEQAEGNQFNGRVCVDVCLVTSNSVVTLL